MVQCVLLLSLLALLCASTGEDTPLQWVLNVPRTPWINPGVLVPGEAGLQRVASGKRSEGESKDAILNYFWGMTGGVVLEMGAINGEWSSESLPFVTRDWHRVLIEGSPAWRQDLKKWTDSYVYSTAVCEAERRVHYAVNKNFFVSGIIEFMTAEYVQKWYRRLYKMATSDGKQYDVANMQWDQLGKGVQEIECLPMSRILQHSGLNHINLMILDVEGAELVALKSIDFKVIKFDVIVVEFNRESELHDFFRNSDYVLDKKERRNLWFRHRDFVPFRKT